MWSALGSQLQPVLGAVSSIPGMRKSPLPCRPARPFPPRPETSKQELDSFITELHTHGPSWVQQGCKQRDQLLEELMKRVMENAPLLASDCAQAKGSYGSGSGEELSALISVAICISNLRDAMKTSGAPPVQGWRTRADGQKVAEVFPSGLLGLLFSGFRGEVWIQPQQDTSQGRIYRDKQQGKQRQAAGSVSLVLGAGNQATLVIQDVLHKLLSEDEVVLLKLNPVNDYVGPHLERMFQPFITQGWLRIAYGGKEVGEYLTRHPSIDNIHLTGSADTFNAIVWGSPAAARTGRPLVDLPVTAELGNVTPCIVVPPPAGVQWSAAEMEFQVNQVAAGLLQNCGHNCISLELLVTSRDWPQRQQFMQQLRQALDSTPRRCLWYPGSAARQEAFRAAFPAASVQQLGQSWDGGAGAGEGSISSSPTLLVEGLLPEEARCDTESWGPCLQEVALPGTGQDVDKFLAAAADFVNHRVWGSLSCTVLVHPASVASVGAAAFDSFVASLRYGCIAINAPSIVAFSLPALTWGAFPGNTPADIGSGCGFVHNTCLFDHAQKSVLWGAWTFQPRPTWWLNHGNQEAVALRIMQLVAAGGASSQALGLPGLLWAFGCVNSVALEAVRG